MAKKAWSLAPYSGVAIHCETSPRSAFWSALTAWISASLGGRPTSRSFTLPTDEATLSGS